MENRTRASSLVLLGESIVGLSTRRLTRLLALVSGIPTPADAATLFSCGYLEFRPQASSPNDRNVGIAFSHQIR